MHGQHPHQWAPFQISGLLHVWQISHQISRYVYHEGWYPRASTLCNPFLSATSMSSWASQAHAFHQPVCQRLSWLHHWSVPHVHTIVFSFRMRSRSSMPSRTSSSLDLVVANSFITVNRSPELPRKARLSHNSSKSANQVTAKVWFWHTPPQKWLTSYFSTKALCLQWNLENALQSLKTTSLPKKPGSKGHITTAKAKVRRSPGEFNKLRYV